MSRIGQPTRMRPGRPRLLAACLALMWVAAAVANEAVETRVAELLSRMTVAEKVGQMSLRQASEAEIPAHLREALRAGRIGSVLNQVDVSLVNEMQRIAVEESRLGIPLLIGRDVIHGFRTVLPIPLGQAASWNPDLVRRGARMAALEAAAAGINWTFAPMIDITRDPRWGRIAETLGEDPHLAGALGVAMVAGFQGGDLAGHGRIAACAKHFAGYGASEAGRDYATTNIAENELRNVHLRPFRAAVDSGVATLMASFSDLNGIPATGNRALMTGILRDEWDFDGFAVSDWASIEQLTVHGYTASDREAGLAAFRAGVNMEMATSVYETHLPDLLEHGQANVAQLDRLVADILRVKMRLGLFDNPYTDAASFPQAGNPDHLAVAREAALQSLVLLENRQHTLPLKTQKLETLAVIGPLADDPYEQLGTWIFDGDPGLSRTPLQAIETLAGDEFTVRHVAALESSRSRSKAGFSEALDAARSADVVVLFLGEESILSGEAHSRADIGLPGVQADLVQALDEIGKPLVVVILAGRPLTLGDILPHADALLFAWHPGTMGGPAIADVLFGAVSPSGKLPVTFPKMVGQVPIYYSQKNTGKPATPETFMHMDDIPVRMPQTSSGFVSSHLDAGYEPQYPFGYGLSYTEFSYSDIGVHPAVAPVGQTVSVSARVRNEGSVAAEEVVQLYVRDLVGSLTRPVRELKGFQRVRLVPGEQRRVTFRLDASDLAFYGPDMRLRTEPGQFHLWIGGDSQASLRAGLTLTIPPESDG